MDLFIGVEEDNGERGRSPSGKGIVSILNPLPFDLVVDLFSDDPSEVTVPAFVIIPAGETMTFFDLSLAESRKADLRKVTITASAHGWSPGVVTIRLKKSEAGQS